MATAYLSRTQTAGTRTKATFSAWVKRSNLGSNQAFFGIYSAASDAGQIEFRFQASGEGLHVVGHATNWRRTNRHFRDTNGWYHIVIAFDTTQSTANDRVKVYVNGVQETSFAATGNPSQDFDLPFGLNGATCVVGCRQYSNGVGNYFDGQMTHVHLVDGTAYTPTTFGETDATTGIWKPKTNPSVTYGNNGFFLKMENSANMGLDSSGQSNNLTTSGTIIQNKDTPTNNTATWDALNTGYTGATFANANNTLNTGTSNYTFNVSNIGLDSGKWYWETKYVSTTASGGIAGLIGIASVHNTGSTDWLGQQSTNYGYYSNDGKIRNNSAWSTYGNSYAVGDIIGCALDLENNKLYFSKNGTWQNSGDPTSGSTGTGAVSITDPASTFLGCYFAAAGDYDSGKSYQFAINFGDGKFGTTAITSAGSNGNGSLFEYDVPSGYYAVNTKNMAGNS